MTKGLVEAFATINGIVANPVKINSIDEDRFNITKSESEHRILLGCIFLVILFGLWSTTIIILFATLQPETIGIRERYFDGMANSKIYVVYSRGHTAMMEFQKNLKLRVTRKQKLEYDSCSYFGFYDYPFLNLYAGSNNNISQITAKSNGIKLIGRKMPDVPYNFAVDSSFAVSSSYFWVIGK